MAKTIKSLEKKLSGQLGEIRVEQIVLTKMNARWQKISGHNDDGVDGLIFFHDKSGKPNGQIAHVQVKRYDRTFTKSEPERVTISFGSKKFDDRKRQWQTVAGASILIWVDPNSNDAYWANMNNTTTHSKRGGVMVLKKDEFGTSRSVSAIRKLCGSIGDQNRLAPVDAIYEDIKYIQFNRPLIKSAKEQYAKTDNINDEKFKLGEIEFTKVGWRHLTRKSRRGHRTISSLQLLGVVPKIINNANEAHVVRTIQNKDGSNARISGR